MKLAILFLVVGIVQVSASTFAQKVSVNLKNAKMESVLDEIGRQSGYDFFVDVKTLKSAKPVSINIQNANIEEALRKCLEGQSLYYTIDNKTVVIKEKETSLMDVVTEKVTGLFQEPVPVLFKLTDKKGAPLPGGSAYVLSTKETFRADELGNIVTRISKDEKMQFTYIGYKPQIITVTLAEANSNRGKFVNISLEQNPVELQNVDIVSTGYQNIPKERATGSFEVIDNKTLNLVTGTSLLKRLEGNVTGFNFNNPQYQTSSSNPTLQQGVLSNLTIRGSNTLYGSSTAGSRVLVVIDGVIQIDNGSKYTEDQIGKLNYNDVESMTILRDAAAVSVYGSRAANGVIVITTKRGKFGSPMQIAVNSNVTVTEKPDLFYLKRVSTADYVDIQKFLYGKGLYTGALNPPGAYYFVSPPNFTPTLVAEILDKQAKGALTDDEANAQLTALGRNDVRNDLKKYFQRNASNFSNNLSISGGSEKINYYLSAGYDKVLNNTVTSDNDRLSVNSNLGIKVLKNLDLQTSVTFTQTNKNNQSVANYFTENALGNNAVMPYDRLADDQGNPLSILKLGGIGSKFRAGYVDTVGGGRLLDMHYKPLQDIYEGYNRQKAKDLTINLQANYKFNEVLSANVVYGYTNSATNTADYNSVNSYFTRYTINLFTSSPYEPTPYNRSIPLGGIYAPTVDNLTGNTLRGLLNLNKTWNGIHNLTAIAGVEFYSSNSLTRNDLYFGYREDRKTYFSNIDYQNYLLRFAPGSMEMILNGLNGYPLPGIADNRQRTTKEFFNASYSFKNLYTVSGSIAKDASNIFGADFNKSFRPYYSAGLKWNINNESFYKVSWLPALGLRATFGYNGNNNYTYTPKAFIRYNSGVDYTTGLVTGDLVGASNPNLRPEKTGMLNIGLDFGFKGGRIGGSIEVYQKWNKDMIGAFPQDPTLGPELFFVNTADKTGRGIDININTVNIKGRDFSWSSNFLTSRFADKITKVYTVLTNGSTGIVAAYSTTTGFPSGTTAKVQGYGANALFAYTWAGLSNTGVPQGYINGVITPATDFNITTKGDYHYIGSDVPVFSGSFRNTFNYKNFSITANLLYKLGYYRLRQRSSLFYQSTLSSGTSYVSDQYYQRWQKPGDEAFTNVPALKYPLNSIPDIFYQSADINTYKADHIRLQSVSFSYAFNKNGLLRDLRIYGNVQNLGIVWRANKLGIDPDISDLPQPRTYAIGLSKTF